MLRQELIDEIKQLSVDEQLALIETLNEQVRQSRLESVQRLRGILGLQDNPPTDEELKEDYIRYLEEKYR
jgi:hypothetical protein